MKQLRIPLWTLGLTLVLLLVMSGVLSSMGRVLWCACGTYWPWSSDIWSTHNSQHVLDPYTFSHILHGVLFYGLFRLILGEGRIAARWLGALTLEISWEVLENSSFIINKYRESTISLDYFGDSVINSVADVVSCMAGYGIAAVVPAAVSVLGFVTTELLLAWFIRDNLILNIIMLVYPLDAIKQWQLGGTGG